jgi:putative nucleotidyltransferase with HDIG domain
MSVKNQLKLLVGGLNARRAGGSAPGFVPASTRDFLDRSRLVAALIFIFTVVTIVLISWAGMTTSHLSVLPNQVATVRVTASAAFTYESVEKTRVARAQFVDRVPPVYRLDTEPFRRFEPAARALLAQFDAYESTRAPTLNSASSPGAGLALTTTLATRRAEFSAMATNFNLRGPYHATAEDVAALLAIGDAKARAAVFENGLATLRDLYAQGVADSALAGTGPDRAVVFQIAHPDGVTLSRPVQNMEDALTLLRVSLATDGVPRSTTQAVFRIFRFGLVPNVVYDSAATQASLVSATRALKPVRVSVVLGQSIIEPGDRITAEQYEMFQAHRSYLMEHGDAELNEGLTLFGRVLLVLAMVLASLIYIRLEDPETLRSNVRCGLLALVVIINLTLIRANYSLGGAEFFMRDGSWASTLPYVAPTALAPLIVAILIDAGSGIFMALLISIFTGVIYGNRLDLLVLTFLASLVAIYIARDARRRGRVVRAAGAGGLTVAAFAALIGIADQTPADTLARQMTAGLATGLLTGIAVVGLLPVLESLFKRTTDITLLELTDYNHPLLRRMQLEAPGTYHHSLVVAQLSENACNAIGANPLVARVCALFHDVGKTENAAYFAENQRDGINPHDALAPAESARLIKRHVSDGVDLALKHNLPRAVLDVIRQHHGTSLVRYFYNLAVEQSRAPFARQTSLSPAAKNLPRLEALPSLEAPATVDEASFRYDGPTPQFKESAVISLADGVEAASRSLRTATPEALRDLIDRIVRDRINDGQLDSAPLTFEEITKIKNSFQFTLLNMLHARVAYPSGAEPTPDIAVAKA